jgi:hypothetical protein
VTSLAEAVRGGTRTGACPDVAAQCVTFTAGSTATVRIAGAGQVPADATAVAVNVTAVGATAPGDLAGYPQHGHRSPPGALPP